MNSELISFELWGQTISIYFYGIFLLIAVLVGILILYGELKRRNLETKRILDNIFWILLLGIIGARLGYALMHLNFYFGQPIEIFKIWQGGLNFTGGLIFGFGAAFVWLYTKNRRELWPWLDSAMIALMLGHAVGMLGSFTSGVDYGRETSLPWGIKIAALNDNILRHPTQIYEFIAYLLCFIVLGLISSRIIKNKAAKIFPGFIFLLGFSLTFFIRFMIEFVRVTDSAIFNLWKYEFTATHIISLLLLFVGLFILIYKTIKFIKK